jgi:hypothetical protein
MSESTDDLTITPFFDSNLQSIHPAVGVAEGDHSKLAYVGVYVPCKVTDKEGHVTTKDFLYLITSEREKILALDKELLARNWRLGYKPIHFETRWNLADVQEYLNGEDVDVVQTYKDLMDTYKEFLEFSDDRFYVLNTLWSIGSYFHVLFNSFSYLYVGGIKRSGKTKTLTLHSAIDFNAIFSNNMSSSSLYRLIQNSKSTLLIDESEQLDNAQRAQAFRNILLSGYKKGAKTFRCEKNAKDRIEPEAFEIYSPKMLGNIGGLEDVLEDRCITTFQRRTRNLKILNSEIEVTQERYAKLRADLYKLFLLHWNEVAEIYGQLKDSSEFSVGSVDSVETKTPFGSEFLAGRELELWKSLITMAKFFDKYLFVPTQPTLTTLIIKLACDLAKLRHTENMTEVGEEILVQCLLDIVPDDQKVFWVKVKTVTTSMEEQFDSKQDWLSTIWVGRALRRLGFSDKRRLGAGIEYNIPSKAVLDLKARMQIEERKEEPKEPKEPEVKSCFICNMALPVDHFNTTMMDGKEVHLSCFKQVKEGLNEA